MISLEMFPFTSVFKEKLNILVVLEDVSNQSIHFSASSGNE